MEVGGQKRVQNWVPYGEPRCSKKQRIRRGLVRFGSFQGARFGSISGPTDFVILVEIYELNRKYHTSEDLAEVFLALEGGSELGGPGDLPKSKKKKECYLSTIYLSPIQVSIYPPSPRPAIGIG